MTESWDTEEQKAVKDARVTVSIAHEKLIYALEGRRVDITAGNRGDADTWIRHIDAAYLEYSEALDELSSRKQTLKQSKLAMLQRLKDFK